MKIKPIKILVIVYAVLLSFMALLFWKTETPPIGIKAGQVWWSEYNDWDDPFIKQRDTVFFEIMEIRECAEFWGHDYVDGNMSWSNDGLMNHKSV